MPEPRIFHAGDPEPSDVAEVRHTSSQRFQACVTVDTVAGIEVSRSQCWTDGGGDPLDWADLTRRLGSCTLTEVARPDQGGLTGSSVIVEDVRPASQDRRVETITPSPVSRAAGTPFEGFSSDLSVIAGHVCAKVDSCTCGTDLDATMGQHEPTCGWEPVGTVEAVGALLTAGQTALGDVEWGYLRDDELDQPESTRPASEAIARQISAIPGWVAVSRPVGPWTVTE
jgi:hypothetical protein